MIAQPLSDSNGLQELLALAWHAQRLLQLEAHIAETRRRYLLGETDEQKIEGLLEWMKRVSPMPQHTSTAKGGGAEADGSSAQKGPR